MAGDRQSASQAENVGSTESLNPKFGFPGGAADSAALTSVQEPDGAHGCSWRVLSRRKLVSNAVPDAIAPQHHLYGRSKGFPEDTSLDEVMSGGVGQAASRSILCSY